MMRVILKPSRSILPWNVLCSPNRRNHFGDSIMSLRTAMMASADISVSISNAQYGSSHIVISRQRQASGELIPHPAEEVSLKALGRKMFFLSSESSRRPR